MGKARKNRSILPLRQIPFLNRSEIKRIKSLKAFEFIILINYMGLARAFVFARIFYKTFLAGGQLA